MSVIYDDTVLKVCMWLIYRPVAGNGWFRTIDYRVVITVIELSHYLVIVSLHAPGRIPNQSNIRLILFFP